MFLSRHLKYNNLTPISLRLMTWGPISGMLNYIWKWCVFSPITFRVSDEINSHPKPLDDIVHPCRTNTSFRGWLHAVKIRFVCDESIWTSKPHIRISIYQTILCCNQDLNTTRCTETIHWNSSKTDSIGLFFSLKVALTEFDPRNLGPWSMALFLPICHWEGIRSWGVFWNQDGELRSYQVLKCYS